MSVKNTFDILQNLRNVMKHSLYEFPALHAYIIPSCDSHQSEYISPDNKRLAYVSGFTGSRGLAVVTENQAALWTDGRYFLQAGQELDSNWTLMKEGLPETLSVTKWLIKVLPVQCNVGVDPFLISFESWKTLSKELKNEGHNLLAAEPNLVDLVWKNKPVPQFNSIVHLPIEYTGLSWQNKVKSVQKSMKENKASLCVLTALDDVAWLLNLRGSDIAYNPVFFAYVIVTLRKLHFFVNKEKLSSEIVNLPEQPFVPIELHDYNSISKVLKDIVAATTEGKIWVSSHSSYAIVSSIQKKRRLIKTSPVTTQKALKNEQEISGMKKAHIKDAVALCQYFAWLSSEITSGNVTEISGAQQLESYRRLQEDYMGPSFETISSSGPNGSIVHYRPKETSNRTLNTEEIYLCDSGGQYRDGTTDVTRTYHFGSPTPYQKECYTRVLKGHISLSSAIFPKLIKGNVLDSFARKALWETGLDYSHGTGHGVGAFLNVHEGPMSFSSCADDPGLQPGMIISIEPGYYEDEVFGIRLENLVLIKKAATPHNFKNKDFLTFEPLTLVPYQTKLIDPSLLTAEEIKWINDYHLSCREVVGKVLEEQGQTSALQWLLKETLPLG